MNSDTDVRPDRSLRLALAAGVSLTLLLTWRLAPHAIGDDWLRRPLFEDAYYYLTIARNVGQGRGVTYDGAPVNGFQPLYLVLCVLFGSLTGWSTTLTPVLTVAFTWALYTLVGTAQVIGLWRAAAPRVPRGAAFAALLWLLHPYGARSAFNGMETSLALVAWLLVARVLVSRWRVPLTPRDGAVIGGALGFAFLARNDTVILTAVWGLATLWRLRGASRDDVRTTLRAVVVAAVVWLLCAMPWMAFNVATFGTPLPQSGSAEGIGSFLDHGRAQQAMGVLGALDRQLLAMPVPVGNASLPMVVQLVLGGGALFVGLALLWGAWRRAEGALRDVLAVLTASVLLLAVVYGTVFGAPWNGLRWLAPATIVSVLALATLAEGALSTRHHTLRGVVAMALLAILVGRVVTADQDARNPCLTNTWPILQRALRDRPAGTVASFQSGLLGWAAPRRIMNLDGKMNHDALVALRAHSFPAWLVRSEVDYMLDFGVNMHGYDRDPTILAAFERRETDEGIVILQRRVPRRPQ